MGSWAWELQESWRSVALDSRDLVMHGLALQEKTATGTSRHHLFETGHERGSHLFASLVMFLTS